MVEKTEYEKLKEQFEGRGGLPTPEEAKRFYEDRVNNQPAPGKPPTPTRLPHQAGSFCRNLLIPSHTAGDTERSGSAARPGGGMGKVPRPKQACTARPTTRDAPRSSGVMRAIHLSGSQKKSA